MIDHQSEISVQELSKWMQHNPNEFQLIDVREQHEREAGHIGGVHMPLSSFPMIQDEILLDKNKPTIVYCRSGARSARVCEWLTQQGYTRVMNLTGGMLRWIDEIDDSLMPDL